MTSEIDTELRVVVGEIRALDNDGSRTAKVLRESFDQLYDGARTGRYRWDQLYRTEFMNAGKVVEINIHREFKFQDGVTLDFLIGGLEVDCKYSQTLGGWMIPPEARGHLCLLLSAEDSQDPTWSMGIVRITPDRLNTGGNRDAKSTLNRAGRDSIEWIFRDSALPPNVLLQLDRAIVDRIMSLPSGQKKINELFRCALGRIVGRNVVATVGKQDDYMKRVRKNGGARTTLKPEGIIILGQYGAHATIARALRLPVPKNGESLSVRITPASAAGSGVAKINGRFWKIARPTDPIVSAPDLPKI
jgi:hypothetical protein